MVLRSFDAFMKFDLAAGAALLTSAALIAGCSATQDAGESSTIQGNRAELAAPPPPPLPAPGAIARALDTECYRADGAPPVSELGIRQLNPVLIGKLPNQRIKLHELMHTCLPVAKNANIPPDGVLPYVSMVDLNCYRAEADPVDVKVTLSHLNPVLKDLPDEVVKLVRLNHFCTPVRKNFADMAPAVRRFASRLDLACYQLEQPTSLANRPLWLSHLNPIVKAFGFPDRLAVLQRANHLCVPVAKNQEVIPDDVLQRVQYIDLLAYQTARPVVPPPFPLVLSFLNPLFADAPPTQTVLHDPGPLLVPVAKNHVIPPG